MRIGTRAPILDDRQLDFNVDYKQEFVPYHAPDFIDNFSDHYLGRWVACHSGRTYRRADRRVAILGATGAGKSTLINLVPRLYEISAGRVLIDGIDIRHIQQDVLLKNIGMVPQETILFSGTVRDNIRYGSPYANEEEIIAAARVAQAHDFIMELSHGYGTHIEQRGTKILILDDSTSAVDIETENKIHDALKTYRRRQTCLIVTQRINTALKVEWSNGRIY